ncbi:MAG: NAD-dependent malic enzyme [Anaerolineae bacterium]|nr:NAD-dependent malic enzyme [Anaerolineae bacterium]
MTISPFAPQELEQQDTFTDEPYGVAILHDPLLNQGMAFTKDERVMLGLRGLLPPRVLRQHVQEARVLENFRKMPDDLQKYMYLIDVEDCNETLFYRTVIDNLQEMMPIIYTPTVGKACQLFGHIYQRPRGLYISAEDRGEIADVVANWPHDNVRVIVVTDGERILGLGDLGANGMGIPVGKISLYTACGGIDPETTLPITLDAGTNNEKLLADPLYIGLPQRRLIGPEYDAFIDEFVEAVEERFPGVLIQFEDFANHNAFRLLKKYRHQVCTFNDDIQGTAAVALAGIYSALRITGKPLTEQQFLFLGAGEAGVGIADLIVSALGEYGVMPDDARKQCWLVDSKGLVVAERDDLAPHKLPYAHDFQMIPSLLDAIETIKPTVLIGVCGQSRQFSEEIIRLMAHINERPIIFALSNPTSKAECSAEQAYTWSDGRAIYASGSPFPPFEYNGKQFVPGQGNNAYIFPGIGLGVVSVGARHVTDEMFMAAAHKLAELVDESDLSIGLIYPPLDGIRAVSAEIGAAVAAVAYEQGLATTPHPTDLRAFIKEQMYEPRYRWYV